jgi:sulfatase maturation enzyme AslB (radical SAM superfamily)
LNSHIPAEHDKTRGVTGSFDQLRRNLERLVATRDKLNVDLRVTTMQTVTEQNYRDIPNVMRISKAWGASRHKLNMLQPTFALQRGPDDYYAEHIVRDVPHLMAVIKSTGEPWSPAWLAAIEDYWTSVNRNHDARLGFRAMGGTSKVICNSCERNMVVGSAGEIGLCHNFCWPRSQWRRFGDLDSWWQSKTAETIREGMRACRYYCGISHSVRRDAARTR